LKKEDKDRSAINAEKIYMGLKCLNGTMKERMLNRAKNMGFTVPQFMMIYELRLSPFITLHELSERLELPKSTVSRIVDQLVKQGKVKREIPEENRRIVKISIVDSFRNKTVIKDELIADLASHLGSVDSEQILKALEELKGIFAKMQ
jgi:DNA-binding MarR family transcriptional regulator